jgi:4-amino-4-deoxy-L-arabinose transferase-like glycosyltransferase
MGSQLYDPSVGLIAVALLAGLKLGALPDSSGIPHVDIGRIARFDILIPVWTIGALLLFLRAQKSARWSTYLAVGVLGGLATLTHVYGAFVLVIAGLLLLWEKNFVPILYIALGWLLALAPFALFVAQDFAAYQGQMLRHAERLGFFDPAFYVRNITEEPFRFLTWFGGSFHPPDLWPRIGIWVFILGLLLANGILWRRIRTNPTDADRLTWIALPAVWVPLLLLITLKRYVYITLLMPFFVLQLAVAAVWLWRVFRRFRWLWMLIATLLVAESVWGVVQNLRFAARRTPYETVAAEIQRAVPSDARVMGMPIFWYALRDADYLSLDLAFVKSAERFHYDPQPTAYDVIGDYAPTHLLIERGMLTQDPATFPRAELAQQWADIQRYLATRCAPPVVISDSADYGTLLLAACDP